MSFREEKGQDTKGSLCFLAGWFGQFGFLLLYFTMVSLNPDSVFRALLKSYFYFYNTAVAIPREAFWSQRQLMLALLLSFSLPLPSFALGGLFGKPFSPWPPSCLPCTQQLLNHPSGSPPGPH